MLLAQTNFSSQGKVVKLKWNHTVSSYYSIFIRLESLVVICTRKHFEVTNLHNCLSQEMYSSSCMKRPE